MTPPVWLPPVAWLVVTKDGFCVAFTDRPRATNYAARSHGECHPLVVAPVLDVEEAEVAAGHDTDA